MKQVSLDRESAEIQRFVQNLPIKSEEIELVIGGRIVCRVIPSAHLSEAEKERLVRDRWDLISRAHERTKSIPARVLEREVLDAVDEVRRRQP